VLFGRKAPGEPLWSWYWQVIRVCTALMVRPMRLVGRWARRGHERASRRVQGAFAGGSGAGVIAVVPLAVGGVFVVSVVEVRAVVPAPWWARFARARIWQVGKALGDAVGAGRGQIVRAPGSGW
jgi:hypothetical protein